MNQNKNTNRRNFKKYNDNIVGLDKKYYFINYIVVVKGNTIIKRQELINDTIIIINNRILDILTKSKQSKNRSQSLV